MANAIQMALSRIKGSIPMGILQRCFTEETAAGFQMPWEEVLRQRVINERVLQDCNLQGGKIKHQLLDGSWIEPTTRKYIGTSDAIVYRIPNEVLEGSSISAVVGISPPTQYALSLASGPQVGGDTEVTMATAAGNMLDAHLGTELPQTPNAVHLNGNLIKVYPAVYDFHGWVLSFRLGYTDNLANMSNSEIEPFCQLVMAATKSHIYNSMILDLERSEDGMGAELGAIRSIIESYEPEEEDYQERLRNFAGGSMMSPGRLEFLYYHML